MPDKRPVYVVDDDPAARDSLALLLQADGLAVECYASAEMFLVQLQPGAGGCIIADIRMPDMDGLELQEELKRRSSKLPVIIVTGHGDVPLAVRAMKAGAIDFLEKPFEADALLSSVRRALAASPAGVRSEDSAERLALLTDRERQVLELIVEGRANKVIAHELSISPRTVELHRARVMDKMQARNLADLVRLVLPLLAPQ